MLYIYKIISNRELYCLGYFFALIGKLGKSKLVISVEIFIQHLALLSINADEIQCRKSIRICRHIQRVCQQ